MTGRRSGRPDLRQAPGLKPRFQLWCILLATALILGGCGGSGSKVYTSVEGRFSVEQPRSTEVLELPATAVGSWAGSIDLHSVVFNRKDEAEFGVLYADLGQDTIEQNGPEQVFDQQRDQDVWNSHYTLLTEESISLQGHPGRQLNLNVTGTDAGQGLDLATFRYYLVGQRLYIVISAGQEDEAAATEMDRFLDSFQLQEK